MPIDLNTIKNPEVREYIRKKLEGEQGVQEARDTQEMVGYTNVAGNILGQLGESQNQGAIMANRLGQLGSTPQVIKEPSKPFDDLGSGRMAAQGVSRAEQDLASIKEPVIEDPLDRRMKETKLRLLEKKLEPAPGDTPYDKKMKEIKLKLLQKKLSGPGGDKKAGFKEINNLRRDYTRHPTTKATDELATAYRKIDTAANNPSAAGDLSLIFGYMKMLDPGSTVREGEFATAQNSAGIPDRVVNMYNKALSGERLNENQRTDFLNQAKGVWDSQLDAQKDVDDRFKKFGDRYGIDFNEFAGSWSIEKSVPQTEQLPDPKEYDTWDDSALDAELLKRGL